jgi:hypothetical protein
LIPGGLLGIPGLVLTTFGAITLQNNQYSPNGGLDDIGVAFTRFLGWIELGLGIACDCASITLLSIGASKL